MSIYRDSHRTPPNDVLAFVETVAKPRTITLSPDAAFALRRKARAANVLLNTTAKWVESLPSDVRPQALCARFPRIANALSSAWPDPEEAFAYFDELLLNGRRGRRGFSEDVLRELLASGVLRHRACACSKDLGVRYLIRFALRSWMEVSAYQSLIHAA